MTLTDAEVQKIHKLLSYVINNEVNKKQDWYGDWLQLMTKIEIHLNGLSTEEPPLVEPHFDENGHPVWPS